MKKLVKKSAKTMNTVKAYACRSCSCTKWTTKGNQKGYNKLCDM